MQFFNLIKSFECGTKGKRAVLTLNGRRVTSRVRWPALFPTLLSETRLERVTLQNFARFGCLVYSSYSPDV